MLTCLFHQMQPLGNFENDLNGDQMVVVSLVQDNVVGGTVQSVLPHVVIRLLQWFGQPGQDHNISYWCCKCATLAQPFTTVHNKALKKSLKITLMNNSVHIFIAVLVNIACKGYFDIFSTIYISHGIVLYTQTLCPSLHCRTKEIEMSQWWKGGDGNGGAVMKRCFRVDGPSVVERKISRAG